MKVYIAGSFTAKEDLKRLRGLLEANGHENMTRWLEQEHEVEFDGPNVEVRAAREAQKDFNDIDSSDAVVIDTHVPSTTGGFYVELGFALARKKPVIIIGERRNIFMFLGVTHVDSWYDAVRALEALRGFEEGVRDDNPTGN